MTEQEKNALEKLNEDITLLEAIKKVLLAEFEMDEVDKGMSNEVLGEITRACITGKEKLNKGFLKLESYKKVEIKLENENLAI